MIIIRSDPMIRHDGEWKAWHQLAYKKDERIHETFAFISFPPTPYSLLLPFRDQQISPNDGHDQ